METSRSVERFQTQFHQLTSAGMHRHFRMIALSGYLRNHGYDPAIDRHTQIPGIWKKLGTLYNLEAIDEREDFDFTEEEDLHAKYRDFSLPLDEYGTDMMERGRDRDYRGSPPCQERHVEDFSTQLPPAKKRKRDSMPANTRTRESSRIRDSTVEDTDEPKTSPPPLSVRRGRSRRGKDKSNVREVSRGTTVETESTRNGGDEDIPNGEEDGEESEQDDTTPLKSAKDHQKGSKGATKNTRMSSKRVHNQARRGQ